MKWFHKIMPREEKFFVLFDRHAACLKAGAVTLRELLNGGPRVTELCATVMAHENDADQVAHEVLEGEPVVDRLPFRCLFGPLVRAEEVEKVKTKVEGTPLDNDNVYAFYFHGPAFQVLDAAWRSDGATVGRWADDLPPGHLPHDGETVAVNHVIDRVFVADGCRWIVDYKTVRADADDSSTAMQMRAGEYRPQLERYAALFSNDPLPLRMAIFFPLQGVLVELPRN